MKLKTKIILLCLVSLLGYSLVAVYQFNSSQTGQKKEIRQGFSQYGKILESSISQVFYNLYHNPQAFTHNSAFTEKKADDVSYVLNELVNLYQIYDAMIFIDAQGNFIAANDIGANGKKLDISHLKNIDWKESIWFKDASSGKFTQDMDKKIFGTRVGSFEIDEDVKKMYGEERLGQHFTTIVDDGFGGVLGVLTTFAGVRWVQNEVASLEESLAEGGKTEVSINVLSTNDTIIAANETAMKASKTFGKGIVESTLEHNWFKNYPGMKEKLTKKNLADFSDDEPLWAFSKISNRHFLDELGWKVALTMKSDTAFANITSSARLFYISLLLALLLTSAVAVWVGHGLSTRIKGIAEAVFQDSNAVFSASEDLAINSTQLSTASTQQAASLQETAASLDEINAMVMQNTESCVLSKTKSQESKSTAEYGQESVRRMSSAMEQISAQNSQIVSEMETNNKEIREVIKVIAEIEEKTRVINDIVFQTKLLSFNASVEAARAGEHGKGFSVVAEEVGKLAEMSGRAAKEISDLLSSSLINVESIINTSTSKVERLINDGKSRIEEGIRTVKESETSLVKILENVSSLNEMMEGIAAASQEQNLGLQEISKAMGQLDAVTQSNSVISVKTSNATFKLNDQAGSLKSAAASLLQLVEGDKSSHTPSASPNPIKTKVVKKDHFQEQENIITFKTKPEKVKKPSTPAVKVSEKKVVGFTTAPMADDDRFEDV